MSWTKSIGDKAWAHRTLIVRRLKQLDKIIPDTVVDWKLNKSTGWNFTTPDKIPECQIDPINKFTLLREIYKQSDPQYDSNITVPVLYDIETKHIVNNESADVIRILNKEFNEFCATDDARKLDLYPEQLQKQIDEVNELTYENINNGVYKCGFAQSQEAYNENYKNLFDALDKVEQILSKTRYLVGSQLTEADIRLYTTLIRFDAVYNVHFKCNGKRIIDYPNIHAYLCDLYNHSSGAFKDTTNMTHIKHHYYESHTHINPTGIVPNGPIDYKLDAKYAEPRAKM